MFRNMNKIARLILVIFWIAAIFAALTPYWVAASPWLIRVAFILIVAHLLEYCFVHKRLRKVEGTAIGHFFQTFVFGILYWSPLLRSSENSN
jgi:uncharacterized protein YhhL (DUF1145 family)